MKKLVLIIAGILITQPGYKIMPVLAEETALTSTNAVAQSKESAEIRQMIEAFLQCSVQGNIECLMSHVSDDLLAMSGGNTLDYNGFKLKFENLFQSTTARSFDSLKIVESNISDNKATILLEYNLRALTLPDLKDTGGVRKAQYSLVKEGGSWKIVAMLTMN